MTATAIEILKYLPKKDCGRCGKESCFEYALRLSDGKEKIGGCSILSEKQKKRLYNLLAPKVSVIEIGPKNNFVVVGGEEVLYRHEFRFVNETKIFIDISDLMPSQEIGRRIDFVKKFRLERVGQYLRVDGAALRCESNDADKFACLVKQAARDYKGPIILCSPKPEILAAAAPILRNRRPLLYAATEKNALELQKIAAENNASLALHSKKINGLIKTARILARKKFNNIMFDCGVETKKLGAGINNLTVLRKSAVNGMKEAGYPIISSTVQSRETSDSIESSFNESLLACTLIDRYASLIIMHTTEAWALLPVLTLRQSMYLDPKIEPTVESKLYEINNPGRDSPILLTSNFALTYYSVLGDAEKAKISCFILPIDTSGLAVTVSVAADILTANKVKEALEKNKVEERVNHRKIIIPGFAARLKTSIEEATKWEAVVGPNDSSQLQEFLKKPDF